MARPDDPNRRMGRNLIVAAWVLGLGLTWALFDGWFERRENPNQTVEGSIVAGQAAEVTLLQNRAGHYVANGAINGRTVTFLLDTGATQVSVPGPLARRLGLSAGAAQSARTASGVVTTYATRLQEVTLGPIVLHDVPAHINPHMPGDQVLLGMSFLRHLEFSQSGRTLTLRQHL